MNQKNLFSLLLIATQLVVGISTAKAQVNTEKADTSEVKLNVEKMPQFSTGGDKALYEFIMTNMVYPLEAREQGVEEKVILGMVIEKDGSVTNVKLAKEIKQRRKIERSRDSTGKVTGIYQGELIPKKYYDLLVEEGIRIVKSMPKWIPGEENGVKVRVQYYIPISFILDQEIGQNFQKSPTTTEKVDTSGVKNNGKKKPQFSTGGDKGQFEFLAKNIRYPMESREFDAQGKVIVSYIIEADGSVTNIKIEKSAEQQRRKITKKNSNTGEYEMIEGELIPKKYYDLLDAEAIRVVKLMPKWIPGEENGVKVRVSSTLPIVFKLD